MSKAAEVRLQKAKAALNADLDTLVKVLGDRCPLYNKISTRDRDFLKVRVTVEGKFADISYTWDKEGFGKETYLLVDDVTRFAFERFCEVLYGKSVEDAACRSTNFGIRVDADFDK